MPSRRTYLAAMSLAFTGCLDANQSEGKASESPTETTVPDRTTDASRSTASASGTPTPELDLREANVVGVEWTGEPGGDVSFDVTLYHDDSGEDGYANWWQVETTDGTQLGRRELLHAHGTRRFTRSKTIAIPAEVSCVVVRGHDQTHEYGGQAAHVNLVNGRVRYITQGAAAESFAGHSCPE